MRIQPWMTAVTGAAMLLASQTDLPGQVPEYGAPQGSYGSPGEYYPSYAQSGGQADPYALYPQGVPENFNPWPQVSPFHPGNVAQDTHYNSKGLWYRRVLNRQRTYEASLGPMLVMYGSAGDALVGSPYVKIGNVGGDSAPDGPEIPGDLGAFPTIVLGEMESLGFYPVTDKILPFPAIHTEANTFALASRTAYPVWGTGAMGSMGTDAGIKGTWGFFNEDDTGMMITAWYGGQGTSDFSQGNEFINGIRVNQSITAGLRGQNLTPRIGNVPLYNGEPGVSPIFGMGSTAKFDVYYEMKATTEAAGTNINFYQQPLIQGDGFRVKPLWGLRYQYIGESFGFRGIDSGYNYTMVDADDDSGGSYRPDPTTLTRLYDQFTATLHNSVESHIAGPEIGMRFDLGESRNSNFKIWGESNLGIAVNAEQLHLKGDNIGDALYDARFGGVIIPRMLDPANDSTFDQRVNTAHVSPMFQQSVNADMRLLQYVPVIKNMSAFDNAVFRVGYTFQWIGEVSRPTESINWQGYPLKPEIKIDRSSWTMSSVNFSFDWTY